MSPEVREHHRKRMISDNPMKDPDVARRAIGASKQRFLQDPSHGWHRNSERLRTWLHRHPSESQKQLYALLDEMGLEYDQEYRIQPELRLASWRNDVDVRRLGTVAAVEGQPIRAEAQNGRHRRSRVDTDRGAWRQRLRAIIFGTEHGVHLSRGLALGAHHVTCA